MVGHWKETGLKAIARYLACIAYRLFTKGQAWVSAPFNFTSGA